ncbi:MAG: YceI family protein [Phototrophicaceae bacterium]
MKSIVKGVILFVTIGIIVVLLFIAYIWVSGGSGQASAPLVTPELILQPDDSRRVFAIDSTQSEARFLIDEVLLGEPTTVIGRTHEVAGELLIDFESPGNTQLGAIVVNVGTLQTDNELRNRALRGQILQANNPEYEIATFVPVELLNFPDEIQIGNTINFQINGTLNLHGFNQDIVFDVRLTVLSNTQIEGLASASVQYTDFNITIPEAAGVANVSDDVRLEFEFTLSLKG